MKTKLSVILALSMAFIFVRFASADEEKGVQMQIPATVAGIWQEVKEQEDQLDKTIADKKLDKVHHFAFAIRDLVNAMPDKSTGLPVDSLAKIKSNGTYIANIATRLDEAGDANDQASTEANFKKLQNFLKTIEAQYPPEELK